MLAGCGGGGDDAADTTAQTLAVASNASVALSGASAALSQTSDTAWTLGKTGTISGSTVTWQITATKGETTPGRLVVNGQMTVKNSG